MGYLELLNVRFVCQISLITMIIACAMTIFSTSVFVNDLISSYNIKRVILSSLVAK